jgi:hypothetical protein
MWRRVDLVRTDVSEERVASIFRVEKHVSEKSVRLCQQIVSSFVRLVFKSDLKGKLQIESTMFS